MQVAMIVGIVIIFAGLLFSFASDIFDIQTTADSISMQRVTIQKAGTESYVAATIKNTGNRVLNELSVNVLLDINANSTGIQPFRLTPSPVPLDPGMSASGYARLVDDASQPIAITHGQEVSVVIDGETADGGTLTESFTVRVQ